MILIEKGSAMLADGAIVPSEAELEVILHALVEEHDRVARSGGDQYGPLSLAQMAQLIKTLQAFQEHRRR